MLVPIAFAGNESEAAVIRGKLNDAGIPSMTKGPGRPGMGIAGMCDVYVEDRFAMKAREALATQQVSDEELARLSDEAGREYGV